MTGIVQTLIGAYRGAAAAVTDAYFNLVTLLLPGNGTNGAQNNTFLDSSSNNFSITRNPTTGPNAPTQGTFSPFSQSGWSNYFNGTTDNLSVAANAAFQFGTGDFCVEAWIYITNTATAASGRRIFSKYAYSAGDLGMTLQVLRTSGNSIEFNIWNSSKVAQIALSANPTLIANTWYHIAVSRSGANASLYVNGSRQATTSSVSSADDNYSAAVVIGSQSGAPAGTLFEGYISNARLVKGSFVYDPTQSSLTVPTSPLTAITNTSLLTCQSNRFVDNSSNAFAITANGTPSVQAFSPFAPTAAYDAATNGGSGYFDGTGDYLRAPSTITSVFGLDTSNFTYETWIYIASAPSSGTITFIDMREPSGGIKGFTAGYTSTGNIQTLVGAPTAWNVNQSFAVSVGQWVHYALTRSSNVFRIFINGELKHTSATITGSLGTESRSAYIGSNISGAEIFNGYISGSRLVIGGALYTATFSVPTSPPTTTVSAGTTQLLLNYTNAGITDATAKNDLETVGNAQISTTQSKWGGSSMSFDGTTDCLFEPSNLNYGYGSGDFTIEFWLRLNSTATQTIVSNLSSAAGTQPHIYYKTGPTGEGIKYFTGNSERIDGGVLSINQWYHIAVCKASGTTRMFINGTQAGSSYTDANNYGTSNPLCVGDYVVSGVPTGSATLNGYIDDLRITKYARYTANFTAPTAAFPVQ